MPHKHVYNNPSESNDMKTYETLSYDMLEAFTTSRHQNPSPKTVVKVKISARAKLLHGGHGGDWDSSFLPAIIIIII